MSPYLSNGTDKAFPAVSADDLLEQLSIDEKVALCGGQDWWRTASIRHGGSLVIPHLKVIRGEFGFYDDLGLTSR